MWATHIVVEFSTSTIFLNIRIILMNAINHFGGTRTKTDGLPETVT